MSNTNNPPEVVIELPREVAQFLLDNCDVNIGFGLAQLQTFENRASAEKMVALLENFKAVKAAVTKGLGS